MRARNPIVTPLVVDSHLRSLQFQKRRRDGRFLPRIVPATLVSRITWDFLQKCVCTYTNITKCATPARSRETHAPSLNITVMGDCCIAPAVATQGFGVARSKTAQPDRYNNQVPRDDRSEESLSITIICHFSPPSQLLSLEPRALMPPWLCKRCLQPHPQVTLTSAPVFAAVALCSSRLYLSMIRKTQSIIGAGVSG